VRDGWELVLSVSPDAILYNFAESVKRNDPLIKWGGPGPSLERLEPSLAPSQHVERRNTTGGGVEPINIRCQDHPYIRQIPVMPQIDTFGAQLLGARPVWHRFRMERRGTTEEAFH
jgi:hypothetical protein